MSKQPNPTTPPLYPSNLSILGKPYSIKWNDDLEVSGLLGACAQAKQVIWLSTSIAPAQLQDTAMHEVLHIISDELKLGLEEETICRLSCGLYSAGARIQALASLEADGC